MRRIVALTIVLVIAAASQGGAQARVGSDSATRLLRLGRDLAYGTAEGLAFAAVDQARDVPSSWGRDLDGYRKRALSNVGEFWIQEIVTEGLAAAMDRPLDYTPCRCANIGDRAEWALKGAVTDQMRNGTHPLAIPRILGAYAGSFAQASWRPAEGANRTRAALLNGTVSLAIGAVINLYYEFR
jgi:hypothetical protein